MKVFVRTSQMGRKNPQIIATYPAESSVAVDAHGPDATMLDIPDVPLIMGSAAPPPRPDLPPMSADAELFSRLPDGWRENLSGAILQAEAKRRIDAVMPLSDQVASLHEALDTVMKHGVDVSKWPPEAQARKTELDATWNYVRSVRERAQQLRSSSLPSNPSGDKLWPSRNNNKRK
jgi:hypothetical protein